MDRLIIHLTEKELVDVVQKAVELAVLKTLPSEEKLLSPAETCKIFQPAITKKTLWTWTNQGLLTDHRLGGRVYYKLSEIIAKSNTIKKYKNNG